MYMFHIFSIYFPYATYPHLFMARELPPQLSLHPEPSTPSEEGICEATRSASHGAGSAAVVQGWAQRATGQGREGQDLGQGFAHEKMMEDCGLTYLTNNGDL